MISSEPMTGVATLRQLLVAPFRMFVVHRRTIQAFVRRDMQARYVSSTLGLAWAVIHPLTLLALYTFIFSYILRVRLGGSGTTASFAVYLVCGMLPWLAFAEGVTRSAAVVLEHTHLIKKVVFPSEILPAYVVLSAFVTQLVGLALLFGAVTLFQHGPGWGLALLPVVVVFQLLLTMGLAWFLASVNVFLRDVGQGLGLAMTLWMFLTPIFYPADMVPERFRWLFGLNPMFYVVESYRDILLEQRLPGLPHLAALALAAVPAFVAGYWFFSRSKHAFVDVL